MFEVKGRESTNNSSSSARVTKDPSSGDKRLNAASGEQHVASKRRKDRAAVDVEGNDRWNGGDYVNVVDDSNVSHTNHNNGVVKGDNSLKIDSKLTSSSKGLSDAKGKSSSRRHVEETVGLENDESGKKVDLKVKDRGTDKEKDKGEKESRRKEAHKDVKEKDRERDKRVVDGKRYSEIGEAELKKKQVGVDGKDDEKTKKAPENNGKVFLPYNYFYLSTDRHCMAMFSVFRIGFEYEFLRGFICP